MEVEGGLRLVGGGRTEELRLRRRQVEEPVSERIHLSWIREFPFKKLAVTF
jgi:hypothetical protein